MSVLKWGVETGRTKKKIRVKHTHVAGQAQVIPMYGQRNNIIIKTHAATKQLLEVCCFPFLFLSIINVRRVYIFPQTHKHLSSTTENDLVTSVFSRRSRHTRPKVTSKT